MRQLHIELKDHSYDIRIENGLLEHLVFYIEEIYQGEKVYIVTDDNVAKIYLDAVRENLCSHYQVESVVIPHGESSKSLEIYAKLCEMLLEKEIRRNHLLIALGGGVIGDLTGFVSATLYRGLPYVSIPTSLLSQVDSSIGGKTGIDFYQRKNILGAFKQPKAVLIDPNTLKTLPAEEFNNGMGELIKHGVIGNVSLLRRLKEHPVIDEDVIYESLTVKKKVVESDEFDTGNRMILNFGHTFGHILELKRNLRHGEAVSLGMLMAIRMGMDLNLTPSYCYRELKELLEQFHLPAVPPDYKNHFREIVFDKKNISGTIQMILIKDFGQPILYPVSEKEIGR